MELTLVPPASQNEAWKRQGTRRDRARREGSRRTERGRRGERKEEGLRPIPGGLLFQVLCAQIKLSSKGLPVFSVAVPTSGDVAIIQEKQHRINVPTQAKKSKRGQQGNLPAAPTGYRHLPVNQGKRREKDQRTVGVLASEGTGVRTAEGVRTKLRRNSVLTPSPAQAQLGPGFVLCSFPLVKLN